MKSRPGPQRTIRSIRRISLLSGSTAAVEPVAEHDRPASAGRAPPGASGLERRLQEEKLGLRGREALADVPEDDDDLPAEEQEALEETLVDQATASRTIAELEQEIGILRQLEQQAISSWPTTIWGMEAIWAGFDRRSWGGILLLDKRIAALALERDRRPLPTATGESRVSSTLPVEGPVSMKNSKGFLVQADRDPAREEIVQHILQEMKEERIPGASICVVKEGRVVLVEGFGIANRETGDPVTSKTLFNIGSVSKSLTSLLLTMLADEGLLDLNTPIGHYVKELPPLLAGVTTAHLLSNTGGLIDFPTEFVEKKYDQNWPQTFMRIFKKDEEIIFWPPGEIFSYSSSGFVIAAAVAEIVSQKPFVQLMQEKVFIPAGMVDTTFIPPQEKAHRTSIGYGPVDEDGSFKRFSPEPEWFSLGAGAVFSTVEDMSGFAWFLMNEGKNPEGFQVFPKDVIASMLHPHILIQSNPHHLQYGFGLFITQMNNGTLIAHEGATDGYASLFRCVPETGFVWISLTNKDFQILQRTSDWALKHHGHMEPLPPTLPDSPHLPAPSPNELCGKYFQGGNRADYFEISLSEDQLYIYHPEFCGYHPAVPLILVDGHRFEFTPPFLSSPVSLVVVKEGIIDVTEIRYCKEGLPTSARRRGEHR